MASKATDDELSDCVEFVATIPMIQSAIKIGDLGARLQFDVPDSEMTAVVRLLAIKNERLRITIRVDPD